LDAINRTSGDGSKNGNNYEIKISIHSTRSKCNFVQIRPDHDIEYYIFIAYNMYGDLEIGNAHCFKIPSAEVYNWLFHMVDMPRGPSL